MIDSDLALLYNVPTKALKQQVKRNNSRFPVDFMFELNSIEKDELVTNCDRFRNLKHSSVNPMVFTEQGVAMLSTVLRSEKAIQINIEIMRSFARYRAIIRESEDLRNEIIALDNKLNNAIHYLMERIDELHQNKNESKKSVGFKYTKRNEND